MKTLFSFFLSVLFLAPVMYSSPNSTNYNSELTIPESETNKFTDDPIAYILENFDLKKCSEFLDSKKESEFLVTFKCAKGRVVAKYNNKGKLIYSKHKFKNVSLPREIMAEIYRDYKGWEVIDIDYRATGRDDTIKTARYKVQLKKENQIAVFTKKIKY